MPELVVESSFLEVPLSSAYLSLTSRPRFDNPSLKASVSAPVHSYTLCVICERQLWLLCGVVLHSAVSYCVVMKFCSLS